ncbi:uncharacterized protein V6R79_002456 [Siganus canaliculatus]
MNVNTDHVNDDPHQFVLQVMWDYLRAEQQQIPPYLPASYAFLTHVLLCAPFLALDSLASVSQRVRLWRIAAGSGPPPCLQRWMDCFWRVLCRYLVVVLPVTVLVQVARSPVLPVLAPSCWQLFVEVFACFLLFDTTFFIWHFSMHSWLAVEDHCGYDLPWALHRLLPCLGGAPFHQAHHSLHRVNYAPYFTHWDHLFGTYHASEQHPHPE